MTILVYRQLPEQPVRGRIRICLSTQDQPAHDALSQIAPWEFEQMLEKCLDAIVQRVQEKPPCD